MAKATIQCAKCDRSMVFGGMSASMAGSVSEYDAVATVARVRGWKAINSEWRRPDHVA